MAHGSSQRTRDFCYRYKGGQSDGSKLIEQSPLHCGSSEMTTAGSMGRLRREVKRAFNKWKERRGIRERFDFDYTDNAPFPKD